MKEIVTRKRDWIRQLPLFLLVAGCGVSSGMVMALAAILYVVLCRQYHEPFLGPVIRGRHFKQSLQVIAIALVAARITVPFNGGSVTLLLTYISCLAPFLLAVLMMRPGTKTYHAIWYGVMAALIWLCLVVLIHPGWQDRRLSGPFDSPQTLAGFLTLLVPIVFFGAVKYRYHLRSRSILSLVLCILAMIMLICTGSRNGYLTFAIGCVILAGLVYHCRDLVSLKLMGAAVVIACLGVASISPAYMSQSVRRELGRANRIYLAETSLDIVREHPLVGIGMGNWSNVYETTYAAHNPSSTVRRPSPGNVYLQSMAETGLIGFAGFLCLILWQGKELISCLRNVYRRKQRAFPWLASLSLSLLSVYIFGFLDDTFFGRPLLQFYWLLWGLCLGTIAFSEKEADPIE